MIASLSEKENNQKFRGNHPPRIHLNNRYRIDKYRPQQRRRDAGLIEIALVHGISAEETYLVGESVIIRDNSPVYLFCVFNSKSFGIFIIFIFILPPNVFSMSPETFSCRPPSHFHSSILILTVVVFTAAVSPDL